MTSREVEKLFFICSTLKTSGSSGNCYSLQTRTSSNKIINLLYYSRFTQEKGTPNIPVQSIFKRTLSQEKTATSVLFSNKTFTIQSHLYKSMNTAEINSFKIRSADIDKLDSIFINCHTNSDLNIKFDLYISFIIQVNSQSPQIQSLSYTQKPEKIWKGD